MKEDIKLFLDYLIREKKYSQNTLAAYSNDLNQLAAYVDSHGSKEGHNPAVVELNAELLSGYMGTLKEKRYSTSTVARKVAAAKTFLKFMVDKGKLKSDLMSSLASPQVNKPLPQPLTVSEVRRFLAEPSKRSTLEAKRNKSMLELLYTTGLRVSELMSLNVEDIKLGAGSVRCVGKNARERIVPIDPHTAQIMKEYIDTDRTELLRNEEETALFLNRRGERLTRQGFWQIVQGYADKAGLSGKVTPRSLRHSFAIHKLKGGADLQSVKELLGHAHISTTKTYNQVNFRA